MNWVIVLMELMNSWVIVLMELHFMIIINILDFHYSRLGIINKNEFRI